MGVFSAVVSDPHEVVRLGVRRVLASAPLHIVGDAHDGPSTLIACERHRPALLITELSLAGITGARVIERLAVQQRGLRVLVYTERVDEGSVRVAFGAGATGYVLKHSPPASLSDAVLALLRGDAYVDPRLPTSFRLRGLRQGTPSDASMAEQQVIALVAMGYSNKEIAARLGTSLKTVETRRARAAGKLGLANRADFVRYALSRGWLSDLALI